jgi:Zn-dependent protease with chaperone function
MILPLPVPILVHFIAALLLAWIANWIGLISWRRAVNAHWTERARLLWPVRFTAGINLILIPLILENVHQFWFPETANWSLPDVIASFLGATLGRYPLDREIFPHLKFEKWREQVIAGWGLRFGILAGFLPAVALMPVDAGWGILAVAGGYLAFHFAVMWGLFLVVLRLVKVLKPAGPRLQGIVDETSARMNVKVRKTWQLGGLQANAFAFPTTHELLFTNRLLEICGDAEVAAICSHELGHLQEPPRILAARLITTLAVFPVIFVNPLSQHFGTAGLLVMIAGMLVIAIFARKLSLGLEKRADKIAVADQAAEGLYAAALQKLYRENQAPAVNAAKRHTHPHLFDRMVAAGVTPDFPRPNRPKKLTWVAYGYIGLLVIFLGRVASKDSAFLSNMENPPAWFHPFTKTPAAAE